MNILILGGTAFLGPHIVEYAISKGHKLTLFNRGKTNPGMFPDVEKLIGDRDGDLKALEGKKWDAAIDTCGYYPRVVKDSAELLAKAVNQYVFISSVSVYADFKKIGIDESYNVGRIEDETTEKITGETYGPLKALCEQAAEAAMPGRTTNIRPGLIVGPLDRSDRFTYWPVRVDRGGEVLSPGDPNASVQIIDVRDLAGWIVRMVEDGHTGVYNAVGPKGTLTLQELLHGCKVVSGSDASFTWVDSKFLLSQNVGPWMELPIWTGEEDSPGFEKVSNKKAVEKGLAFQPVGSTIKDTLEWAKSRPADYKWRAGLDPEKEKKVLKEWLNRTKSSEEKNSTNEVDK